jgi:hypothetical protein
MVTLLQKEETYEVEYKGVDYMVTIMTDVTSGYITYDVFGPNGEILETDLELEVAEYVERNIQ